MSRLHSVVTAVLASVSVVVIAQTASAETIQGALAKAYENNSELNSARAGTRVTDEGVAIAKSGYRPQVSSTISGDYSSQAGSRITTGSFGIGLSQTLFDGFQTRNNVRAAKSQVFASQQGLRNTVQNTLFNAASAYMDVIRDRQIVVLQQRNLEFLVEQVRASRSRLEVGEGTRTDVAQAEAGRATAEARLAVARAAVATSEATYNQIIGARPGKLSPASPLAKALPRSLGLARQRAEANHPAIRANRHLVDAAGYVVKSNEGAFLPSVTGSASISRNYRKQIGGFSAGKSISNSASIGAKVTVPLYQGGRASATVRQSKESLGQARIDVDVTRDRVLQNVAAAWYQYHASIESVSANRQVVSAARLALNGVIEERDVGQRTTLDVLDAQADVITAQIDLAQAERDVVVASYAILSAMGDLGIERLKLRVAKYDPDEHFKAVKDKWYGLRTPDGR